MRCPKCGFISFDHLTACNKCGKDIADVAAELQGTTIKVEPPMFLSSALAAFADREAFYGGSAMDTGAGEGIDFSMEDEVVEEETGDMSGGQEDIDFSFEAEEAEADISMAEAAGSAGIEDESEIAVDLSLEDEAQGEAGTEAAEESLEELDLVSTVEVEEEDEGGLEFDLEDFIDDIDSDDSTSSRSEDMDLDMDDEEK